MEFINTADGSKTLYQEAVGEHYHSKHGALRESKHVFLDAGLRFFLDLYQQKHISILEVGFGTGLNFLVSADYCLEHGIHLLYNGVETHPLAVDLLATSGYRNYIGEEVWQGFLNSYTQALKQKVFLQPTIEYRISVQPILDHSAPAYADVVFFDAFAEVHQPEMWTPETLAHVASLMKPGGVFVTYAITGNLKRTLKALEFDIEKVPGAPGKREMLRAIKRK